VKGGEDSMQNRNVGLEADPQKNMVSLDPNPPANESCQRRGADLTFCQAEKQSIKESPFQSICREKCWVIQVQIYAEKVQ
jgi:hypothetical protein